MASKNVRLGADGKYHWHWDPARRRSWGDRLAYRDRLHVCANHLNPPVLLGCGGLCAGLSDAGAQSCLQQCPHAEYVNVANAAHMVAGDRMTSSQNPLSHSSSESHQRAE